MAQPNPPQSDGVKLSIQTLITILTTIGALLSVYVNVSDRLSTLMQKSVSQEESIRDLRQSDAKLSDDITELKTKVSEVQAKLDSHLTGANRK